MVPSMHSAKETPSTRAALVRERLSILPDNEIVYVDRLGPRILRVPPNPTVCLSRDTLSSRSLLLGESDVAMF
jgi:hypothetical protein